MESVFMNKGRANAAWIKNSNLSMFCPPQKWIKAFLSDKRKPTNPKHFDAVADWRERCSLPEFEPFFPAEIKTINAQNEF
jgi:hypothetical protein